MGSKARNRFIKFIPLDTPQNILRNYSPPTLLVVSLIMLTFALVLAYRLSGVLPFVVFLIGIFLGTSWTIFYPPHPFLVIGLLEDRDVKLSELPESALCLLSFFKSREAGRIALIISSMLIVLAMATWCASFFVSKSIVTSEQRTFETTLVVLIAIVFFTVMCTYGIHVAILYRYALKHWNRIQREREPWPVDKPYHPSFKFWRQ